jgi:perosamine synthetase
MAQLEPSLDITAYRPSKMILIAGPSITEREIGYVTDAITNGWNEHWGDYLKRFQTSFAEYVGVKHAMATSSCTGAMHIALKVLGIGPGDEVLVPEITWVATASVVRYVGATPVFVDVAEGSWCMDPASLERKITPRTKAIMPVHLYGHPADMPAIMAIAEKHNLLVLEDAAPSVGAVVGGRRTGSFGHMAAFSFQGAKVMVTGEGGMLVSNDDALMERSGIVGDHGRDPHKVLWNNEVGHKYKMSNLQAALGLAQLERIEELVDRKREIHARYSRNLAGSNALYVNQELPGCRSIHWMTSVEIKGLDATARLALIDELRSQLIDTRPVFYPLSSMPMFERDQDNTVAYRIGHSAINLPSGHNISDADIDYTSEVLLRVCGAA